MRFKILLKGNGVVMFPVLGTIHQCHQAPPRMISELIDRSGIIVEFPEIALAKLGPFQWIVAKPLTEYGARSDLLEPEIDPGRILGHAPWPEPVHKDTESITRFGYFIRSLQFGDHRPPEISANRNIMPSSTKNLMIFFHKS